jgi:membrane protease YdiL (CAAX protease family)
MSGFDPLRTLALMLGFRSSLGGSCMHFHLPKPLHSWPVLPGSRRSLAFCILTFALTWPVEGAAALSKLGISSTKIPGGFQMLAALSPGIAALILSLRRFGGRGAGNLLRPLLIWRVRPAIYVMGGLFSFGACFLTYELITTFGQKSSPLTSPFDLLMYFLLILPLSALWEETGWRGFLLPSLMEGMSRLRAALLIGVIWGAWHLPIFLAAHATFGAGMAEFGVMFFGCITMSIILTWLYLESRGSLLICVLFHNAVNAGGYYFFIGIPGSSLLPLSVLTALLGAVAAVLVPKLRSERGSMPAAAAVTS